EATREQPPIGAPGQRVHGATLTGKPLHQCAAPRVPHLNEGIIPTTGEQAPIRSKGDRIDASGVPTRPEEHAALDVPELDGAIPTPAGQGASIRTESQSSPTGAMGVPGLRKRLASCSP